MTNKQQLFLLHFAGGSIYSYDFLRKHLKSNVEFIPLELPGRGKRYFEHLLKVKEEAIDDYFIQIKAKRNNNPYLIYGHSMGATLGLSVTAKLETFGDPPMHLVVSGNAGPGVSAEEKIIRYLLDDISLKDELKNLGGVPLEVLENNELFDYFAPIMRADFECLEKYYFTEKGLVLSTPIYALMGTEEETSNRIDNWGNFTKADFHYKLLEGNHFFIYNNPIELLNVILNNSNSLTSK